MIHGIRALRYHGVGTEPVYLTAYIAESKKEESWCACASPTAREGTAQTAEAGMTLKFTDYPESRWQFGTRVLGLGESRWQFGTTCYFPLWHCLVLVRQLFMNLQGDS